MDSVRLWTMLAILALAPACGDDARGSGGTSSSSSSGLAPSTGDEHEEGSAGTSRDRTTGGADAPTSESTGGSGTGSDWPTVPPSGFSFLSAEHEDICIDSACGGFIDTSVLRLSFRLDEPGQVELVWHDFSVDGSPLEFSDDPLSAVVHEVEHTDPITFVMDHRPEPSCAGPGWEQTTGRFLITFNGSPFVLQAPSVGLFGLDQPC